MERTVNLIIKAGWKPEEGTSDTMLLFKRKGSTTWIRMMSYSTGWETAILCERGDRFDAAAIFLIRSLSEEVSKACADGYGARLDMSSVPPIK